MTSAIAASASWTMSSASWSTAPRVRLKHLVEDAADLLSPLLAVALEVRHRFVRVEEDEARRPAVLAWQLGEGVEHAGDGLQRKTSIATTWRKCSTDLRHDPAPQVLAADEQVQVRGVLRQCDRVNESGDAVVKPAQEVIVHDAGRARSSTE